MFADSSLAVNTNRCLGNMKQKGQKILVTKYNLKNIIFHTRINVTIMNVMYDQICPIKKIISFR